MLEAKVLTCFCIYGSPVLIALCFLLSVLFVKKALKQLDSEQAP